MFGWRGAAGLAMSGVAGYGRLSIGQSRVSSTLPSHQAGAGNGTRLFIRPWLFLLDRYGEGPAPAGQFTGNGDVLDDPALMACFELVPLVMQAVITLVTTDPGVLIGCIPAGTHLTADVALGPAVVPSDLDQQSTGVGVAYFW